ncbi:MAG: hypothetical protein UY82_C0046G0009 [Candidatus Uhrbacteria bacterium GW2011_GWC2_53_7]|uniref:Uncharacterized protein n=1 Tax=Candidatus Uhrbacteria bacterium GW2011_GWC2_53_7 TaxID=1618986 RepID=A0A0G2A2Z0_9BACT|nr:MAG: hypothetical protein UY82_C0046G0009 [Candidatus Uhrbacteria bacterium GW2011_GWC2_53_7]
MSFADDGEYKNPSRKARSFWLKCLGALDVHGAGTPIGVLNVERHSVAFAEFVITNADESRGMKERVFLLAFDGDEAEPFVCQSSD